MSSFAASEREETPASAAPAASKARSPTLPAGSEEPGRAARAAGGATPALPRCPAPAAPPSPSPAGGSDLVSVLSWRSGAEPAGANPGACSALGAAEPGRGVDGPRAASPALAGRGLSRDLLELVTLGEASGSGLGAGLAWGSGHGAGGDSRRCGPILPRAGPSDAAPLLVCVFLAAAQPSAGCKFGLTLPLSLQAGHPDAHVPFGRMRHRHLRRRRQRVRRRAASPRAAAQLGGVAAG